MSNLSGALPPDRSRHGLHRMAVRPRNLKGTLLRLWDLMEGRRKLFAFLLALAGAASGAAMLAPLAAGRAVGMIDRGSPAGGVLALLAALYLGEAALTLTEHILMASASQGFVHHVRVSLFNAMKRLPLSFFDRHLHGELMSRLTNDADTVSTTISTSLTMLFTQSLSVLGIFVMMLRMSPPLAGLALCGAGLILLLMKVITDHTRKLFRQQQKILGALNGQIEESISGLSLVKAFGREAQAEKAFEANNEAFRSVGTKALVWSGYLMPITNVINNLLYLALAVASGVMALQGSLSLGTVTAFLLYGRAFTRPFVNIANVYNDFQSAVAGLERIFEIMDEVPEPPDRPGALELAEPRGDLELRGVSFGYEPGRPVLKDISLKVRAGTRVAVVGPTGAGKTTLVNLLPRFYDVTEGQILLDGRDIRDYRRKSLRRAFSVVLQDTVLFASSIAENIAYGSSASRAEIEAAARMAGADSFIERLPDGYGTILHQGGLELSQGERQLLTIARALLTRAPILIFDEATSSVDTLTEQKIHRAMAEMTEGRTSFIIAHRLSTIRSAHRILFVDGGRIIEDGAHEELLALGGRYARLWQSQAGCPKARDPAEL